MGLEAYVKDNQPIGHFTIYFLETGVKIVERLLENLSNIPVYIGFGL